MLIIDKILSHDTRLAAELSFEDVEQLDSILF
jgi:hypothetical protein